MTGETLYPPAPEALDITTPDGFSRELFGRLRKVIETERAATVAVEVPPQSVRRWGNSESPSIDLIQGLIFSNAGHNFGLSIGDRGRTTYDDTRLDVGFGLISNMGRTFDEAMDRFNHFGEDRSREEKALNYLRAIVNQPRQDNASGRFYTDRGTIEMQCSLDLDEIRRWAWGRILSEEGLYHAVRTARDVFDIGWRG